MDVLIISLTSGLRKFCRRRGTKIVIVNKQCPIDIITLTHINSEKCGRMKGTFIGPGGRELRARMRKLTGAPTSNSEANSN